MSIYCEYRKKMIQECRNSICEADFNDFGIVTGQALSSYETIKKFTSKFREELHERSAAG